MGKVQTHQRIVSFLVALVFILYAPLPGAGGRMTYSSVHQAQAYSIPAIAAATSFGLTLVRCGIAVGNIVTSYAVSYLSSMANYLEYQAVNDAETHQKWISANFQGWEDMPEDEANSVHVYAELLNLLNMNQAYYDEKTESPFYTDSSSYFGFGNWRPIDRGNSAIWTTGAYAAYTPTWKGFYENPDCNLTEPSTYLADSNYLAIRFNVQQDENGNSDGFALYRNAYFASGLFTFEEAKELSVTGSYNSTHAYKDDETLGNYYFIPTYQFFQYDGEHFDDENILNILDNNNWVAYGNSFEGGTQSLIFNEDKLYVLVVAGFISESGNYRKNYDYRIREYIWFRAPEIKVTYSGTVLTNESAEEVFSTTSTTNNVAGDIIYDYSENYYNSGNWWQGDNNGDGNVDLGGSGSGDGSGDGNISGDLNVNVDGSLDHNVSGDLDININLPGFSDSWFPSGADPPEGEEESSSFWSIITGFFSTVLSGILSILTFLIDGVVEIISFLIETVLAAIMYLVELILDSLIGLFSSITDSVSMEVVDSMTGIFGFMPEEARKAITSAIILMIAFSLLKFFKG